MSRRMSEIFENAAPPFRQVHGARPTILERFQPRDVAAVLETSEQLIHRLLADTGAIGKHARAHAITAQRWSR
jgi:hypothetical protein